MTRPTSTGAVAPGLALMTLLVFAGLIPWASPGTPAPVPAPMRTNACGAPSLTLGPRLVAPGLRPGDAPLSSAASRRQAGRTDAAGKTTTLAYNSAGQITSVVNAKGESTTFAYVNGYLDTLQVNGQTQASLTYDGFGRVHTVTDVDSDVTSFWYDDLDRPVRTDYPDGSFDQVSWNRLDAEWIRDREGRWTHVFTNALRQTVAVRDPAGRLTGMQWCICGSLGRLIDPEGRITRFDYDLQGRLVAKALPDQTKTSLVYDTAGRVTTVTDAKGQVATYAYLLDGRVSSLSFSNAAVPTGGVSYQYDPIFGRLTQMVDDVGTTVYAYHPITPAPSYTAGAGRLASVDGPWSNDTVTYAYDEIGRVVSQSIGTGNTSSVVYDALGRVDSVTNVLGLFDYVYEGSTGRVSSLTYPNGQQTTFSYLGQAGLRRLSGIMNRKTAGGTQISIFTYGYDTLGRITSWGRSFDGGAATTWAFGYDRGDQLASAILRDGAQAITASYAYGFDRGGNRTFRQNGGSTVAEVANALNQLTDEQTAGKIRIEGQTDEASTVTINGVPAQTTAGTNAFAGEAAVEPGSNTITVQATDGSGNVRTNQYSYNNANGVGRSFLYDLNGNVVSDGLRAYAWDAADRLVSITWLEGAVQRRSEFSYNGQGQRIRIRETSDGTELSNRTYLWVGATIAEERDSTGGTVAKRFQGLGEREGSTNRYYTMDHLGSIREVTNQSRTVLARYDYTPYGERTRLGGSMPSYDCFFGFTGHVHHAPTGFALTLFRVYDPVTGRWLSRDPIEREKYYSYCSNDPINRLDVLGGPDQRWHHLLPRQFAPYWNALGINHHDARYGLVMRLMDHQALHAAGWNDDWQAFFDSGPKTPADVEKQLKKMLRPAGKYGVWLSKGSRTSQCYQAWRRANWAARLGALARGAGAVAKATARALALLGVGAQIASAASTSMDISDKVEEYVAAAESGDTEAMAQHAMDLGVLMRGIGMGIGESAAATNITELLSP